MKKIKSILTVGSIAGVILAVMAVVNLTNMPQNSMAAVTATPAASATVTPRTTAVASSSTSPNPSATVSASATPTASPTEEPAMSVMNAPVEQKITKKGLIYEYTATYAHLIGCTDSAKQKKSIHIPAKIPDIGHHPQRGIFQHYLFFVSDRIYRFSLLQGHIHFQMRVRSNYLSLLSPYRNGNPYQQAVFQIFFHVFKIIYMQDKDNISAIQNKD